MFVNPSALSEFKRIGGFRLDDFQSESIYYCHSAFSAGLPSGIVVVPTGGGKTVVAACLIAKLLKSKARILVLVPKLELAGQWAESINRARSETTARFITNCRPTTVSNYLGGAAPETCRCSRTLPSFAKALTRPSSKLCCSCARLPIFGARPAPTNHRAGFAKMRRVSARRHYRFG